MSAVTAWHACVDDQTYKLWCSPMLKLSADSPDLPCRQQQCAGHIWCLLVWAAHYLGQHWPRAPCFIDDRLSNCYPKPCVITCAVLAGSGHHTSPQDSTCDSVLVWGFGPQPHRLLRHWICLVLRGAGGGGLSHHFGLGGVLAGIIWGLKDERVVYIS